MSVWSSDVFSSNLKCLKTFYFTAKERVVAKKVPCCGTFLGAHELSVRGRWKRLRFYVHTRVFRGAQYNECPFLNRLGRICRSEEHTSELQSLMRISYAVFCLKKKKTKQSPKNKYTK